MLLTREHINRCMNLGTPELRQAMETSGYGSGGVRAAEFLGVNNSGRFVYRFQFMNDEFGEWEFSRVYVRASANADTGALELDVEY